MNTIPQIISPDGYIHAIQEKNDEAGTVRGDASETIKEGMQETLNKNLRQKTDQSINASFYFPSVSDYIRGAI
ncbi:MAG: hypothetical protein HQK65_08600, partial [Desulfamplus sp.]|nr:hypothetical protein [Desulfamplus sp.]